MHAPDPTESADLAWVPKTAPMRAQCPPMRKVVGKLGVRVGMQGCYERLDIIDMSLVGSIYLRQSCDPVVTESDSIHAPPACNNRKDPLNIQFQH